MIAQSGKSHVTITSIGPCYWRMWELLAFEYAKTSL